MGILGLEVHLAVSSMAPECQRRYVLQWLRLWDLWYHLLDRHASYQDDLPFVRAPQWRDYINSSPHIQQQVMGAPDTKQSQQRTATIEVFSATLGKLLPEDDAPAKWLG